MNERLDFAAEIKAEDVQGDGTFRGYASTFGGAPDSYGDVVAPGAFNSTISKGGRNGNGVAMLWQHMSDKPVGVWKEMSEDKRGLKVVGQLVMESALGKEAYAFLKAGAIKGMSIGFSTKSFEFDEGKKIRTLKEVDLWEISLVTFPANTRAKVTSIKAIEEAATERELERALRESGLSRNAALYVAKLAAPNLRESGGHKESISGSGLAALMAEARRINAELTVAKLMQ